MQPGRADADSRKRKMNRTSFDESDVEIDSSTSLSLTNANTPASLPKVNYPPTRVQAQMYLPGAQQESNRGNADLDIESRTTTTPAQTDPSGKRWRAYKPRANDLKKSKRRKQQEITTSLQTDYETSKATTTVGFCTELPQSAIR